MLSVAFQCRVVLYLSKMHNLNTNIFWIKWHGCFRVAEIAAFFIWDAAICESLFSLYNNTDIVVLVLLLKFVSICFSHLFLTTLFQIFLGLVFFSLLKFVLPWALFLIFTIFTSSFLQLCQFLQCPFFFFFKFVFLCNKSCFSTFLPHLFYIAGRIHPFPCLLFAC